MFRTLPYDGLAPLGGKTQAKFSILQKYLLDCLGHIYILRWHL